MSARELVEIDRSEAVEVMRVERARHPWFSWDKCRCGDKAWLPSGTQRAEKRRAAWDRHVEESVLAALLASVSRSGE